MGLARVPKPRAGSAAVPLCWATLGVVSDPHSHPTGESPGGVRSEPPANRRFRLAAGYGVRLLGAGFVLSAIAVLLMTAASLAGVLDSAVLIWLCSAAIGLGVAVIVAGTVLALVRPSLLRFDDVGLHNRTGRAVGVRTVDWREVVDAAWARDTGGHVLLVTLADGRSSRIRTTLLDTDPHVIENDLRMHADHAHGYRPI